MRFTTGNASAYWRIISVNVNWYMPQNAGKECDHATVSRRSHNHKEVSRSCIFRAEAWNLLANAGMDIFEAIARDSMAAICFRISS